MLLLVSFTFEILFVCVCICAVFLVVILLVCPLGHLLISPPPRATNYFQYFARIVDPFHNAPTGFSLVGSRPDDRRVHIWRVAKVIPNNNVDGVEVNCDAFRVCFLLGYIPYTVCTARTTVCFLLS